MRRDLTGKRMRRVVIDVEESAFERFKRWSAPYSYGYTFEKLIEREERRQKKRAEKSKALTKSNSLVNQ